VEKQEAFKAMMKNSKNEVKRSKRFISKQTLKNEADSVNDTVNVNGNVNGNVFYKGINGTFADKPTNDSVSYYV